MLASDPAGILEQIFGRAGIHLTQESTQDDHALVPTIAKPRNMASGVSGERCSWSIQTGGHPCCNW
jgi:hypothetical protein